MRTFATPTKARGGDRVQRHRRTPRVLCRSPDNACRKGEIRRILHGARFAADNRGETLLQREEAAETEGECPEYEAGEVAQSRTAAGLLTPGALRLGPRQILIADFGVGRSSLSETARGEALYYLESLQDSSIQIEIRGYTDCSGSDEVNARLRQERAGEVQRLLAPAVSAVADVAGAPVEDYLEDNATQEHRARNRGVVVRWSPPPSPAPQPGEEALATAEGEIGIEVGGLPAERLYASVVTQGLWWFNGGTPLLADLYPTEAPLSVEAEPGRIEYQVTRGADKVQLTAGGPSGSTVAGEDLTEVTMQAIGKSTAPQDVTIEIRVTPTGASAPDVGQVILETRGPHRLSYLGVDHQPAGLGYLSLHYLRLFDNFDDPLPYMSVNEDFTAATLAPGVSDHWQTAFDARDRGSGVTLGSGVFTDQYLAEVRGGAPPPDMAPQPANPHPGRRSTLVGTFQHDWYAGDATPGNGVHVSRHEGRFHDDHGEYANLTSPPP